MCILDYQRSNFRCFFCVSLKCRNHIEMLDKMNQLRTKSNKHYHHTNTISNRGWKRKSKL